MSLSSGTRVGPYEILGPLGSGGMGEVYRARDPHLGRDVAVKMLPASFAHDIERVRRFEQEARAAGSLNSPHVVVVYATGIHDGAPYLVSELLEGTTLRDRLSGSALPPKKVVEIAVQIARGLAAAHEKGIVHRDLKPENVFVTRGGHVKILDFGLAKLTQDAVPGDSSALPTRTRVTEAGIVMGTAGYMSPEQVRGMAVDQRADIFSFGAMLYEMLAARRAFKGATAADTMAAILNEDPPSLLHSNPELAPGLERLVRHCLEKEPEDRFASARDLAFDLQAFLDSSVASGPDGVRARPPVFWTLLLAASWTVAVSAAAFWLGRKIDERALPAYRALTFRRGSISAARLAPDGSFFLYSAAWDGGPHRVYATRLDVPGDQDLGLEGQLVGVAAGDLFVLKPDGMLIRATLSGSGPHEIAEHIQLADISGDGSRIAVVKRVGDKDSLEYPPGKVLHESVGQLRGLRVSPDGRTVTFLEYPSADVVFAEVKVIGPEGPPRALTPLLFAFAPAWSPDGREVWYSVLEWDLGWSVHAVSLAGKDRIISRTAQRPFVHDTFPDGRVALELSESRRVVMGLGAGQARERDLSWLDSPEAYDISTDGTAVALTAGHPRVEFTSAYLVKFDGSPPNRLGKGLVAGIAPDDRFVAVLLEAQQGFTALGLLPTGVGDARSLPAGSIRQYFEARWLPDRKRLLIAANEEVRPRRLFIQDIEGGLPKPVTPEGISTDYPIPSPDGKWVAAGVDWHRTPYALYPLEGGEPKPIPGLARGEQPMRFDRGGTHLFLRTDPQDSPLARIERLDLRSGRKELWKEIQVLDPAGVRSIGWLYLTPDGRSYVYNYDRELSTLYLADGWR